MTLNPCIHHLIKIIHPSTCYEASYKRRTCLIHEEKNISTIALHASILKNWVQKIICDLIFWLRGCLTFRVPEDAWLSHGTDLQLNYRLCKFVYNELDRFQTVLLIRTCYWSRFISTWSVWFVHVSIRRSCSRFIMLSFILSFIRM